MVLLDSDHLSLLQRGGAEGHRMKRRLGHLPATGSLGSEEFRQELLLPQNRQILNKAICAINPFPFDNSQI